MSKSEERKNDNKYRLIIILLILIILLLLFWRHFGFIGRPGKPTGNIDIFNIGISCKKDDSSCTKPVYIDKSSTKKSGEKPKVPTNNEIIVAPEDEYEGELEKVYVDDKNGNYVYQQKLEIFTNQAFEYTNKIAPGVSNSYDFKVHNENDDAIQYKIKMSEQSEYKVNLKYRLIKNNSYIIGNGSRWVSANELVTSMMRLEGNSIDTYRLDWKWFDHSSDTIAGEKMRSTYKLFVRFDFESIS